MDIYVQKDGQQLGPFSEVSIRQGIHAGEFTLVDLAWTSGKASWQPLSKLIELDVTKPPPLSSVQDVAYPNGAEALGAAASVPKISTPPPLPNVDQPAKNDTVDFQQLRRCK